jgi:hypothetical protein
VIGDRSGQNITILYPEGSFDVEVPARPADAHALRRTGFLELYLVVNDSQASVSRDILSKLRDPDSGLSLMDECGGRLGRMVPAPQEGPNQNARILLFLYQRSSHLTLKQ